MKRSIDKVSSDPSFEYSKSLEKTRKPFGEIIQTPTDCIRLIFSFLEISDVHSFRQTCKIVYNCLGSTLENSYNSSTFKFFYRHRLFDQLNNLSQGCVDKKSQLHFLCYMKDLIDEKTNDLQTQIYFEKMRSNPQISSHIDEIKHWRYTEVDKSIQKTMNEVSISFIWERMDKQNGYNRRLTFQLVYAKNIHCGSRPTGLGYDSYVLKVGFNYGHVFLTWKDLEDADIIKHPDYSGDSWARCTSDILQNLGIDDLNRNELVLALYSVCLDIPGDFEDFVDLEED